jgi:chaperonin cofactor prefoldin
MKEKMMSKNRLEISDSTAISMPMKNLIAIVAAVSMGVWAYFGVLERITMLETTSKLAEKDLNQHVERLEADLTKNTEFRIKWPRGEMGTLPADSEQYMLIEDLYGSVEKLEKHIDNMMNNKINIEFLQKQVEKMLNDIEELKDADREIVYKNGNGDTH